MTTKNKRDAKTAPQQLITPEIVEFQISQIPEEERKAVETVIEYGKIFGYGNLISHLKSAWIDHLMTAYNFTESAAEICTNVAPYPPKDQQ